MAIPSLIQRSLRHVWHPAEGTARLRIALSAAHTEADIDRLVLALTELARPGSL